MNKIITILTSLIIFFTLSSCITTVQEPIDEIYSNDNVDIGIVITNGIPYYNTEGLLLYYVYHGMYYYPYYYHNRYYLHRYHKPLPPNRLRAYKPVPRDFYRHEPPRRHHVTPPNRSTQYMRPNPHSMQPNRNVRPNTNRGGNINRPTMGNRNGRHFSGSRR